MKEYLIVASPQGLNSEFLWQIEELIQPVAARKTFRVLSKKNHAREYQILAPTSEDRRLLREICDFHKVDMALIPEKIRAVKQRLVVFDMDSTLIEQEVINEMAREHQVTQKVSEITERAMRGEIDFDGALRERLLLLKGFKKDRLDAIRSKLTLSPGVALFIRNFRLHGGITAIASGGFHYFADFFKESLPMEYAFANQLEWNSDELSGNVSGKIVNAERKREILRELREKHSLVPEQTIAVGDGANDLLMLKEAGLGVAWHAKEVLRKEATCSIQYGPMTTLLYFLGFEGEFFET